MLRYTSLVKVGSPSNCPERFMGSNPIRNTKRSEPIFKMKGSYQKIIRNSPIENQAIT